MSLTSRHSLFVLASVLLAIVFISGCRGGGNETAENAENAPVFVRVAPVTGGQVEEIPLRFSGIVRAAQRATLTFQVSGTLKERPVELGQMVKPGDVLARLYNPALEPARDSAAARLEELRTQFDQAQREWERSSRLHQRGVVSEQALEQIAARRDALRASMATAEASLAEATRLLEESVLKAPFAGQVEALLVEPDEFVAAGQPVMRLSSPLGREVEVRVPAHLLSHVRVGQELPVWLVQDRNRKPATARWWRLPRAALFGVSCIRYLSVCHRTLCLPVNPLKWVLLRCGSLPLPYLCWRSSGTVPAPVFSGYGMGWLNGFRSRWTG